MNRSALLLVLVLGAAAGAFYLLNRDDSGPGPQPQEPAPAGAPEPGAAKPDPARAVLPGAQPAAGTEAGADPKPGTAPAPAPVQPPRVPGPPPFRLDPQVDTAFIEEVTEVLRDQAIEIETEHERRALTADEVKLVGTELELARRALRSALDTGADIGELVHVFEQAGSMMRGERMIDRVQLHPEGRVDPGLMRVRSGTSADERAHTYSIETGKVRIDLKISREAAHYWKIPLTGTDRDWQTTLQR